MIHHIIGNCLFRSFAHQIYNDVERHKELREKCYNYMVCICVCYVMLCYVISCYVMLCYVISCVMSGHASWNDYSMQYALYGDQMI